MDQILYNNVTKKKICILQTLFTLENGNYSVNHLSKYTIYTQKTVLSILNDLHFDFIELFDYALLSKDQKINWQKQKIDFNEYRQFLVQQSLPYQFVLASLISPKQSLEEFCSDRFISSSTARRLLTPFTKKMAKYGIQVKLSTMSLSGHEFAIRALYFSILWVGSFGADLLAGGDQSTLQKITSSLEKSAACYVLPQKLLTILLIAKLRIKQGHTISEDLFLSLDLPPELDFMLLYFLDILNDENQLHYEYHCFIYFVYYLPFCADTHDPRIASVLCYLKNLELHQEPIARLFNEFFELLKKHVTFPNEQRLHLLKANLFIIFSNFSIQKNNLPSLDEFNFSKIKKNAHQNPDLIGFLEDFFRKVIRRKHFGWLSECLESFISYLAFFIDSYWLKEQKLNVVIAPLPNSAVLQQLYKILDRLTFVDYSINNKISTNTDVYISTYDTLSPCDKEFLYLIPYDGLDNYFEKDFLAFLFSKHLMKQKIDIPS